MSLIGRFIGRTLATHEEEENLVGVGAAIPMLGLDALSSCAYGPEATLALLIPLGAGGLQYLGPISLLILALLFILFLSYRQTISAYPNGGGSYTVARENLGTGAALLAAASLLLDYILNVAVGISAGVGALVSAVPSLHDHIVGLCLGILCVITLANLRGVKESGLTFALPTYLFITTLFIVLGWGVAKALLAHGHPVPLETPVALPAASGAVTVWLLMRAFASGCTALTGVEAVSNGIPAFARPRVERARHTLAAIIAILAVLLAAIAYLCPLYGIGACDPDSADYQSVLSQLVAAVVGRNALYYVTMASVISVLALSANTSFADFPRLCQLLAADRYLPHAFSRRGRRLVYADGIMVLSVVAGILLVAFGGITDRLIPLFAVGAFGAFTLSQAGMVVHQKREGRLASGGLVNLLGAVMTGIALVVVLVAKFTDGAWITVLLVPATIAIFSRTRRHYEAVEAEVHCDDDLELADLEPPIVVVPVKEWSHTIHKALRFACRISDDILCLHVEVDAATAATLIDDWERHVAAPCRRAGRRVPHLEVVPSPYRDLFKPILAFLEQIQHEYPTRTVAVIIPQLVESKWNQYMLHNQQANMLKAALLFAGGQRVTVINVPWYLHQRPERDLIRDARVEALLAES